jgi:hypothetical protein
LKRGVFLAVFLGASLARAAGPADVHADDVVLDPKGQSIEVSGRVRVDAPPFFLTAEHLKLFRSWRGLELEGDARLSFCPCSGPPLTLAFAGGAVAPPGDLFLKSPKLLLFNVPVLWLPYFWLRAPTRFGVLPPEIAYRGPDGLYLGDGVHFPVGSAPKSALDVRGGAYFRGGFAASADLRTSRSFGVLRYDRLVGDDGLTLDARGTTPTAPGTVRVGWDVDAMRGRRAVAATTSLDAAAKRVDRAHVEMSVASAHVVAASGVRAVSDRGLALVDDTIAGPWSSVHVGGALGARAAYDAAFDLATLGGSQRARTLGRTEAGVESFGTLGPVGVETSERFAAGWNGDGDGAALSRTTAALALPLARLYGDSLRHLVEPRIAASAFGMTGALRTTTRDAGFGASGRSLGSATGLSDVRGMLGLAQVGGRTSLGDRQARFELEGYVGAAGDARGADPLLRGRAVLESRPASLSTEVAMISTRRAAFLGRGRLGAADRLHLSAYAAGRGPEDALLARALSDAGTDVALGYLDLPGWSGGVRTTIPFTRWLRTSGGVDVDLDDARLLGARATLELRDACDCVAFRFNGSQRLGRPGVDLWLEIDLRPR